MTGRHLSDSTKRLISALNKGKKMPAWVRAKISATNKAKGIRPSRLALIKGAKVRQSLGAIYSNTKPELAMKAWLESRGVEFRQQELLFDHIWDFVIPSLKLIIEVDGCYWHGCPIHCPNSVVGKSRTVLDHEYDSIAKNNGWVVRRIWEHDLV